MFKKAFKVVVYLFAIVGVVLSAGAGYLFATNSDIVRDFWEVKGNLSDIPVERRREVFLEIPARIKFEHDVRDDLGVLPAERQTELYKQLGASRDSVFDGFQKRIAAEAEIARDAKDKEDALKKIKKELPTVNVHVDMTGTNKPTPPDPLAAVDAALQEVGKAMDQYLKAKEVNNPTEVKSAALGALKALDKLGDRVVEVRETDLGTADRGRLDSICTDARWKLKAAKDTPGLIEDPAAKPYLIAEGPHAIGPKLNSEKTK